MSIAEQQKLKTLEQRVLALELRLTAIERRPVDAIAAPIVLTPKRDTITLKGRAA